MNLQENIKRIKEVMGLFPKPIDISYHEHLIKTFSDDDSEISEDDDSIEKNTVIEKIKDNDFTNDPESFLESLQKSSRKEMLTDYTIEDLENMKTYKLDGYDIGYALKQDDEGNFNEIVSVFNNSGIKGVGDDLIQSAIRNGGRYLDHFDGFLSGFYSKHGFKEYKRDKFDPQYDPTGEFRDKYGPSDIIYRRYEDE